MLEKHEHVDALSGKPRQISVCRGSAYFSPLCVGHAVCPEEPRSTNQEASQRHGVLPHPVRAALHRGGGEGGRLGLVLQERQPQQDKGEGETSY